MNRFVAMAGNVARGTIRRFVRVYYPRIQVTQRHYLPSGGPVLLVANHPNSLIDPVIIGITSGRPAHFLAKAPLFEVPILGAIMRALGMVPAYRGVDDAQQVKRNIESLAAGACYLAQGEAVGIFPEGKSHDAPKLETVRSGAARMVLQALEQSNHDIPIVPLGLNYQRKEQFRSSIWVQVGQPIFARQWLAQAEGDSRRAMRSLTAEIDRRLKQAVVNLNEERWEPFLHDLEFLVPPPVELRGDPIGALRQRKRIADAMNHFLEVDRLRAEKIAEAITRFRQHLQSHGLNLQSALLRHRGLTLFFRQIRKAGWGMTCFLPALVGTVHHLAPFVLVRLIAGLLQTQGSTTVAQVRLGVGLPIYALAYGFIWWAMAGYFRPWLAWLWTALMPFAGVFALAYWRRARAMGSLWFNELRLCLKSEKLGPLRAEYDRLHRDLIEMAEEYRRFQPPEPAAAPANRER